MKRTWTDEQLILAVKNSKTYSEVARILNLANYGANSRTIKKYISKLNLDISHFLTADEILESARTSRKRLLYEEIFCINSIGRKHVKRHIINNNLIEYKCSEAACGIKEWHGQKISLHLDHINGINNDNRLDNLRFLCPNCHSLTDTYCGKQLRGLNSSVINLCIDCNKCIHRSSTRCKSCSAKHKNKTKINWISTNQLIDLVKDIGYRASGKKLGVSGNSIKKRIRNHPKYG